MMDKLLRVFLVFAIFLGAGLASEMSIAGEIDILVKKLVEKGILTHGEAQQVLTETKEEMRKQLVKGEVETLPKWIQKMKWNGDLRLRYENSEKTNSQTRSRGRFRLRYGFEAKVNDQIKIGARFASGTGEQTSTNQSFDDGFRDEYLWIDRAYLEYTPVINGMDLALIGGKMKNPFYKTSLLWDGDINPEGAAFKAAWGISNTKSKIYLTGSAFFLSESKTDSDEPTIFGIQAGLAGKIAGRKYKTGLAYYDVHNIKGKSISGTFPGKQYDTNTGGGSDAYTYDFNILDVAAEYSPFDLNILGMSLPVKIHANYLTNVADSVKDGDGYQVGLKIGKAKAPGTWGMKYMYQVLESDAVIAELTDSDFHGGGTNNKGHKFGLAYAPMKNTTLGITYLMTERKTGSKKDVDTVQVDWKVKF